MSTTLYSEYFQKKMIISIQTDLITKISGKLNWIEVIFIYLFI